MSHLHAHLAMLAHGGADGPIDEADAVSLFYIGAALAVRDPKVGRELLSQLEREIAASSGRTAEAVEVDMRAAADRALPFLREAVR